jgi:hypothetical protein
VRFVKRLHLFVTPAAIGMTLASLAPIRTIDVLFAGVFGDTEHVVVVSV